MKLIFCTNNQHKVNEVKEIMGDDFTFLTLAGINYMEEIPEPFDTLEANAQHKSLTVFRAKEINCFAEDTGLFIEALNGEPGVLSARYAGEPADAKKNTALVMSRMNGVQNRNAFFRTVISLVTPEGKWFFDGICTGSIAVEPSGNAGFGYDPIFIPTGISMSFADMSSEEKNAVSHRKKAFDKLAGFLKNYSS